MRKRKVLIRGSKARIGWESVRGVFTSAMPWIDVGTEARAAILRQLWEREGKLATWFKKAAASSSDRKPPSEWDQLVLKGGL